MRDKFWAMFVEMKYNERYFWHYQIFAKRISGLISVICMVTSISSVATWAIWNQHPTVWAFLIAVAQLLSVTQPLQPQAKQLVAFKFMIPAISNMLVQIKRDFEKIDLGEYTNPEINDLIAYYQNEYNKLESSYVGDIYLPTSKKCVKKAEIECKNYFKLHYNASEGENL